MSSFKTECHWASVKNGKFIEIFALVNSAASHCMVPSKKLEKLGVVVARRIQVKLVNAQIQDFDLGYVRLRTTAWDNSRGCFVETAVVQVSVLFGPDSDDCAVFGANACQECSVLVDNIEHRLTKGLPRM